MPALSRVLEIATMTAGNGTTFFFVYSSRFCIYERIRAMVLSIGPMRTVVSPFLSDRCDLSPQFKSPVYSTLQIGLSMSFFAVSHFFLPWRRRYRGPEDLVMEPWREILGSVAPFVERPYRI